MHTSPLPAMSLNTWPLIVESLELAEVLVW